MSIDSTSRVPDPRRVAGGRMGAHRSWANTDDRTARTAPARRAADARYEKLADPDGVLSPEERARKAEHLRRAAMAELSLRAAQARQAKRSSPPAA